MLPEQRRRKIVDLMNRRGAADVDALAHAFEVSPATIRRDLRDLEGRGFIARTHGGAVAGAASTAFEPLYNEKARQARAEKEAIAAAAVLRVDDGEVVVLDSGSTTHALARELKARRRGLTVITTDLMIALELGDAPGFETIIIGGVVRPQLYSVVGSMAESLLPGLHANHAFLGADAIDLDAGITNASLSEVGVKQHVLATTGHPILLVDHTKFGKVSLARVAGLAAFDEIITDDALPEPTARAYAEAGATLTRAATREDETV